MENGMKTMKIASSKKELVEAVVQELLSQLSASIEEFGCANILLSGGSTPGPVYKSLDENCTFLDKLNIGLVDERFVKTSSEHSNDRLIRNCFSAHKKNQARIDGMIYNSDDKNENLNLLLIKYKHFIERTDIVVLGMGKDGHIASIFPNDPDSMNALSASQPFLNTIAPSFPGERISCSMHLICKSKSILLIITGKEKRNILMNNELNLPIHELLKLRQDIKIFYLE